MSHYFHPFFANLDGESKWFRAGFNLFLGLNLGLATGYALRGDWFFASLHLLVAAYMVYERVMTIRQV